MSRTPAGDPGPPDLPGYQFIKHIGAGGNAQVYLYEQDLPHRKVAVKVLNESALSDAARRRFTAEANVTAGLAHRHIVQVFDANVTKDGRPYLVMPYYPQPNLSVRARRSHFSVADVLRIGIQIGSAVETSHRQGVLHRDIKPQNILTDSYGEPALTDFGIATTTAGDGPEGLSVPWSPPEILYGTGPGDQRADVYSLGATLWHLLAGRSPFEVPGGDNSALALMGRIKSDPPPRTQRADAPGSLDRLLRQAMAKDQAARPQSAMELIRGLQSVEQELRLPLTHPILPADESPSDTRGGDTVIRLRAGGLTMTGGAMTGGALADGALAGGAQAGEPMAGRPVAGRPVAGGPARTGATAGWGHTQAPPPGEGSSAPGDDPAGYTSRHRLPGASDRNGGTQAGTYGGAYGGTQGGPHGVAAWNGSGADGGAWGGGPSGGAQGASAWNGGAQDPRALADGSQASQPAWAGQPSWAQPAQSPQQPLSAQQAEQALSPWGEPPQSPQPPHSPQPPQSLQPHSSQAPQSLQPPQSLQSPWAQPTQAAQAPWEQPGQPAQSPWSAAAGPKANDVWADESRTSDAWAGDTRTRDARARNAPVAYTGSRDPAIAGGGWPGAEDGRTRTRGPVRLDPRGGAGDAYDDATRTRGPVRLDPRGDLTGAGASSRGFGPDPLAESTMARPARVHPLPPVPDAARGARHGAGGQWLSRRVLAVGGGVLALVAAAVAFVTLSPGHGRPGAAASTSTSAQPSSSGGGQNALGPGATAPGQPAVTARAAGGSQVSFSWTYANPAAGDTFRWQRVSGTAGAPGGTVSGPKLVVSLPDGHSLCIVVQVRRSGGQASDPSQPACWPR